MPDEGNKLKLGKGSAFVKRDMRQLPQAEDVETKYANVAEWVNGYGWIEIGIHGWEGFQARALDEGGLIYEHTDCDSLAEAMQELENGLGEWFEEQDR